MIHVSAGHHPYAKGACYKKFCEFDEAKIWQALICHYLGSLAMAVPVGVLKEKVAFINAEPKVDIAVEIHFNAAARWVDRNGDGIHDPDEDVYFGRGSETLYYPSSESGKQAATTMQKYLSEVLKPDRGAKEGWYKMNPDNGPDYFLARTKCTALIIEPEFIHRKELIQSQRVNACNTIAEALKAIVGG